jgi:hypothetical protein
VNDIALTPEEIEAAEIAEIKKPIAGEDGITRYDVRTKPHYWIYAQGVEVWNRWGEDKLTVEEKQVITDDIKKYCGIDKTLPLQNEVIDFKKTVWDEIVNLDGAFFKQYANFFISIFKKEAFFENTFFLKCADFSGTTFTWGADFGSSVFIQNAEFIDVKFILDAFFEKVTFKQYSCFNIATFYNTVIFSNTTFENFVPSFEGTKIEKHIDFSATNKHFPKYNKQLFEEQKIKAESVATQYSILKTLMRKMEFADKELFFHGKELEAKSYDENEPKHLRWLYKRYGEFSDYGQSITQPLYWLFF